jgi:hypothetical protein
VAAPVVIAFAAAQSGLRRVTAAYGLLAAVLLIPAVDALHVFGVIARWVG